MDLADMHISAYVSIRQHTSAYVSLTTDLADMLETRAQLVVKLVVNLVVKLVVKLVVSWQ